MMPGVAPAGIIYTCNPSSAFMDQVEELAQRIPLVIISNRERVKVDAINQGQYQGGKPDGPAPFESGTQEGGFYRAASYKKDSSSVPGG